MEYSIINGRTDKYFVLFHGHGGNEYSLLWVAGEIDPSASIITTLAENGTGSNRRYFAPLINNQLDRNDFEENINAFIEDWKSLKPDNAELTFLGYSNGANFIAGILEKEPDIADNYILLHPSNLNYTFRGQSESSVILTAGSTDTISLAADTLKLKEQLDGYFKDTELILTDSGHGITDEDDQVDGFGKAMYLGKDDFNQLVEKAIEADLQEPFLVVNGVSNNLVPRLSLLEAQEKLDYSPQENAFDI